MPPTDTITSPADLAILASPASRAHRRQLAMIRALYGLHRDRLVTSAPSYVAAAAAQLERAFVQWDADEAAYDKSLKIG